MVKPARVLYGLHERFVLFPYRLGARRARLVVRARCLRQLCHEDVSELVGQATFPVGAPFVLGELLNAEIADNAFVPVVLSGQSVHDLRGVDVAWAQRTHRVVVTARRQLAFESGSRNIFGYKTALYDFQVLLALMEHSHEPNPRAGFRRR